MEKSFPQAQEALSKEKALSSAEKASLLGFI